MTILLSVLYALYCCVTLVFVAHFLDGFIPDTFLTNFLMFLIVGSNIAVFLWLLVMLVIAFCESLIDG